MKKYPSIFNDVLSPVTPGPSSSNTSAPSRISRTVLQLLGKQPSQVLVEMCDHGGYAETFYGMQSDLAFIAGFLDRDPVEYDLSRAYDDAVAAGMKVTYGFIPDLPDLPSELCRMTFPSAEKDSPDGLRISQLTAVSVGGGSLLISDLDGCPTDIRGDCFEVLIFLKSGCGLELSGAGDGSAACPELYGQIEALMGCVNEIRYSAGPVYSILDIKCWEKPQADRLDALLSLPEISRGFLALRQTAPVYDVTADRRRKPPFTTSSELIAYTREKGIPLWQAAVDYEASLSGWSDEQVLAHGEKLYDIALAAAKRGREGGFVFEGVTDPHGARIAGEFARRDDLIPMGIGKSGGPDALGIMEHSNSRGVIVCMPTGGSSGVVPGAIFGAVADMGRTKEEGVKALLTAGLVGVFMFETNYSGFYGCQAEIGCATAMAAAALCTFLTDDAETACAAASLAIQNGLGLVCDPIAGYVQVPCLIRNMTAVPTAAMCANAAVCGFPATVPLDEMAEAILRVGRRLRPCNALGTNATPTGLRMNEECIKKRGR
ncbi:L-serine ammonia-lyase, iron-sulfur-dependent, subunit beta [Bacilliculturomica massiliensis]|uniref:L-serine ammonia-lyase, iron-sulfur-dependent, subunit beta n=1 Tax=Bacilliculturomica massiliensis TaxID=1917867 RepID=UPI00102FAFCD|nr:L-serine ammonia-lyase, iron-sulfur-dependent, subunit alpha [Bacilliculturomica massiliensis]